MDGCEMASSWGGERRKGKKGYEKGEFGGGGRGKAGSLSKKVRTPFLRRKAQRGNLGRHRQRGRALRGREGTRGGRKSSHRWARWAVGRGQSTKHTEQREYLGRKGEGELQLLGGCGSLAGCVATCCGGGTSICSLRQHLFWFVEVRSKEGKRNLTGVWGQEGHRKRHRSRMTGWELGPRTGSCAP